MKIVKSPSIANRAFFAILRFLPRETKRRILFRLRHGYKLPSVPATFSEKIQWRILNDRRELIELTGDKLRMKTYAAENAPELRIPETLWSGSNLAAIVDVDWGSEWVLKPISGSGANAFGSGSIRSSALDLKQVERWRHDQPEYRGEWAYENADRGYLIERKIFTPTGVSPNDLKVFVFNGRARFVYYSTPRDVVESHRFYSTSWKPLDFRRGDVALATLEDPPPNLEAAIRSAEQLGSAYDFIRVDLFCTPEATYFGELTPYPAGGLRRFIPDGTDAWIGQMWELPVAVTKNNAPLRNR